MSETHTYKGKVVAAKRYRPDGTLGAEVKDGKGFIQAWYEGGALGSETPIAGGLPNGLAKEYYEDGALLRTITYKDDAASGEALMYDEAPSESGAPSRTARRTGRGSGTTRAARRRAVACSARWRLRKGTTPSTNSGNRRDR